MPHTLLKNCWTFLWILLVVVAVQILVYAIVLRPIIVTWGATQNEIHMPLPGDTLAPYNSSTRAITIDAPRQTVWGWLIQLGADRGGFFSYTFIEDALGYEFRKGDDLDPASLDFKVGRVIPASLDPSQSVIEYSWPVVSVDPGKSFVLKNWGAFVLQTIRPDQTRLIVRTHGWPLAGAKDKIEAFIMIPLHYIMEKRMMLEFKARSETGARLPPVSDRLWFSGLVLSYAGIVLLIFFSRGMLRLILPVCLGVLWLWPLLVFAPRPAYSLALTCLIALSLAGCIFRRRRLHGSDSLMGSQKVRLSSYRT